jgi:hypothetical protein
MAGGTVAFVAICAMSARSASNVSLPFSQAVRPGVFRTSNKCHVFVNVAYISNQSPRSSSSGQVAAGHMDGPVDSG